MAETKHTPGPWIAKFYESDKTWGVRQSPNAPSVSVAGEVLPCGFSICNIVAQDMEDIENGEERANAELIAAAPETAQQRDEFRSLLIKCYQYMTGQKPGPDAAMLTKELHKTMDNIGITGTAKTEPS